MRLRKQSEGEELGVQMAPLIDCVFLLLIFFLCTSMLEKVHKQLPLSIADASVAAKAKTPSEPLAIDIRSDGTFCVERTPLPLRDLEEHVRAVARKAPGTVAQLNVEGPVAYEHIAFTVNLLRQHGLTNVGLALLEPKPQQSPTRGGKKR